MKIKATIERIPGGMMLVPLVLGAILNTLAPNTGAYFGGFTKGMITGTVPILAVWFFCIGASINLRATGTVLRKSGTLVITKIAVASGCCHDLCDVHSGEWNSDWLLRRIIRSGHCLSNGYDQRRSLCQPDESIWHQRRIGRVRADVPRSRVH